MQTKENSDVFTSQGRDERSTADGPFLWLAQAALIRARSAAGAHGVAVLVALAARAPITGGRFYASARNLADASGLGVRTVFRVLPILARARVIEVEAGRGGGSGEGGTANRYRLLRVNLSYAEGGALCLPDAMGEVPMRTDSFARNREVYAEGIETYRAADAALAGGGATGGEGEEETQTTIRTERPWY